MSTIKQEMEWINSQFPESNGVDQKVVRNIAIVLSEKCNLVKLLQGRVKKTEKELMKSLTNMRLVVFKHHLS